MKCCACQNNKVSNIHIYEMPELIIVDPLETFQLWSHCHCLLVVNYNVTDLCDCLYIDKSCDYYYKFTTQAVVVVAPGSDQTDGLAGLGC